MTQPTITYGHGYLTDCTAATENGITWVKSAGGSIADDDVSVVHGDIFRITGKCTDANDEYIRYSYDLNPNISTNTYTKYVLRWKTSEASAGLGAQAQLWFTAAPHQWLLGEDEPQFSTTWQVKSGDITSAKTIDKVYLFANDHPDSTAAGTTYVDFDFLLLHKDTFTFPFFKVLRPRFPMKVPQIEIPGRDGDIIQRLGMKSPEITLQAPMQSGETWGSKTGATADSTVQTYGEYLYYVARENAPWQWLTSDAITCKVTPAPPGFDFAQSDMADGAQRTCDLKFLMYSLSSLGESIWDDPQWYGE